MLSICELFSIFQINNWILYDYLKQICFVIKLIKLQINVYMNVQSFK